jgi:hypothetical protein
MVTYLHRNVTIVCGASYHLLESQISQDLKIRFRFQIKSYISNWQFSILRHLVAIMSWPMTLAPMNEAVRRENHAEKNLYKEKN